MTEFDKASPQGASGLPFLLRGAARRSAEVAEEALESLGISARQLGILELIVTRGCMTQQAAGQLLQLDRTTVVQIVDALEDGGYLVRNVDPLDRRCHALTVTTAGKEILKKGLSRMEKAEEKFLALLSDSEREQLKRMLATLYGDAGGSAGTVNNAASSPERETAGKGEKK